VAGILGVHDDAIEREFGPQARQGGDHGVAARPADDIAKEQDAQDGSAFGEDQPRLRGDGR